MRNDQLKFFEKQLAIDNDNLDEEIANFPSIFYTVSDHYLEAVKQVKRLEARLEKESASLSSALRSQALQEEIKVTETQLKEEVRIHPKFRKLKSRLTDSVYIKDRWSALKEAYVQKSFSLKGLVSLSVHEGYLHDSVEEPVTKKSRRRK